MREYFVKRAILGIILSSLHSERINLLRFLRVKPSKMRNELERKICKNLY